jgi:8-oxo-dGTP diphosphatase
MLSVTAAILIDGDRVLIAQRGKADHLAGKWEFPGGKIEPGESPEDCLIREMKEEFGIDVAVTGFFAKNVYKYETLTVELLAYYVSSSCGKFRLNAHAAMEWAPLNRLDRFDFAPADIPFAQKLQKTIIPSRK